MWKLINGCLTSLARVVENKVSANKLDIKQRVKISIKVMLTLALLSPLFVSFTGCTGTSSSSSSSGVSAIAKIAHDEWDTNRGTTGDKYKSYAGIGSDDPWCAAFASWCANEAGMVESGYAPRCASVSGFLSFYAENPDKGTVKDASEATPVSGDFFCEGTSHIGIVYSYDADADEIQVVEGNWDNQIHFGKYSAKSSKITKYIHPNNTGTSKSTGYGCSSSISGGGGSLEGNARVVYNKLSQAGYSDVAIAGIMGNLNRESGGFNPRKLQGGGEYEDYPSEYINNDSVGYGIAQWSYHSRSQGLVDYAKSQNKHSGDLELQLDYLIKECTESYTGVSPTSDFATKETDVIKAAWKFHHDFEGSADSEEAIKNNRGGDAQGFYKQMQEGGSKSSSSSLSLTGCSLLDSNSSSGTSIDGEPDFSNADAWKNLNPYASGYMGQCTWFAWGRFYEIYGYSPGFTGNGYECAKQLVAAHPDKFELSSTPKAGAVGSSDSNGHNHVWIVTKVSDNSITMQEGNMNGTTDSWDVAITDWRTKEYSFDDLRAYYGECTYANPKE